MESMYVDKADWVWMGHGAHFVGRSKCGFRLATYVGSYIVSTVGEYAPGETWIELNARVAGEEPMAYETFVWEAVEAPDNRTCCPYRIEGDPIDRMYYATASEAAAGHMAFCEKWS